jgi:hypothetical protein
MSRELLQQALKAFEAIMVEIDAESCRIIAKNARYGLREELAKPEQEEPLSPVDIGVDVTPEGTHVVAFYNRPDAVQEMFYSQFHPLAKPEPKLSDAGADTNISRGLEPKGSGMVTLNQPEQAEKQEPVAWFYNGHLHEVDPSEWALDDVTPLYTAPPRKEWVGLTNEDWENTPNTGKQGCERDAELFDWIEQTLKDKNEPSR